MNWITLSFPIKISDFQSEKNQILKLQIERGPDQFETDEYFVNNSKDLAKTISEKYKAPNEKIAVLYYSNDYVGLDNILKEANHA